MTRKPTNIQASIAARLRNVAAGVRADLQLILLRYAIERLLYRLSISAVRDRFVLKGAMLYTAWVPDPFRSTQDLDLLGFGDPAAASMIAAFRTITQQPAPDDGLTFDPESISAAPIRGGQEYGGMRVKLTASLGKIRLPVQIDVGFGDAVTPAPVELDFPVLLDAPVPRLRTYPRETVVAEKVQAMVALGQVNSRMKDYYDIAVLARLFEFDGASLNAAFRATFDRRRTSIPADVPVGLSNPFVSDPRKVAQWAAFIKREALLHDVGDLDAVVTEVRAFVMPPLISAGASRSFSRRWKPGGPWKVQRKRVTP